MFRVGDRVRLNNNYGSKDNHGGRSERIGKVGTILHIYSEPWPCEVKLDKEEWPIICDFSELEEEEAKDDV